MIRFRTLGTVDLTGGDRLGLGALAAQPKRMGLLAYLAVASPRGFHRRDSLLALFWPEANAEDARTSLRQAVYQLRKVLGKDAISSRGDEELTLNPAVVGCDVWEFEEALTGGRTPDALEIYRGDFLQGFFIPDAASELDEWVAAERARLRSMTGGAAWTLAQQAERAGNAAAASQWAHRAAGYDPEGEQSVRSLITLLNRIGDRPGAIRAYEGYARRLREELGVEPSRDLRELGARVRDSAEGPTPTGLTPQIIAPGAPKATDPVPSAPPRRSRWIWGAVAAVLMIGVVTTLATRQRPSIAAAPVLAVGTILDFTRSTDSTTSSMVADLLATSLSRLEHVQVIGTGRMYEIEAQLTASEGHRPEVLQIARVAGATQLLQGSIHREAGGGLRFDLSVLDVKSGNLSRGLQADGSTTFDLVDGITTRFAREFGVAAPEEAVADVTTHSIVAYRLYEEGLHAYYRSDVTAAIRLFDAALAEDSTFAMAAYQAALAAEAAVDASTYLRREQAVRLASHATDRERLLILSFAATENFEPNALALAETLAIRYPSEPGAHLQLGQVRIFAGDFMGALEELRRTVSMDSLSLSAAGGRCRACDAYAQMVRAYRLADSGDAAERTAREWIHRRSSANSWFALANVLELHGKLDEGYLAETHADSMAGVSLPSDMGQALLELRRGQFAFADDRLRRLMREGTGEGSYDAAWWLAISLRNQGRIREAAALYFGADSLMQYILMSEGGNAGAAAAAFEKRSGGLRDWGVAYPGNAAKHRAWNLTHAATALAAAGDTARLAALADTVQRVGQRSLYGRDQLLYHYIRGLLWSARRKPAEAAREFRQSVWSWSEGYTRANYELGRSLLQLNHPHDAVAALEPALRGPFDANNLYVTYTELHELLAQAFDSAGEPDSARVHWVAVEQAWRHADPQFRSRYLAAKEYLARH